MTRLAATGLRARLTKDLAARRIFAVYLRRIAALLLQAKDFDDRQGLSHPFTLREPCNACIYTAKFF